MKKFLTIAVFLLLSLTLSSQTEKIDVDFVLYHGVLSADGYGSYPFANRITSAQKTDFPFWYSYATPYWKTLKIGTFTAETHFKINEYFTTGFALSYTYIKEKYPKQQYVSFFACNMNMFSAYLMNKITWYNKQNVKLYTSIYAGYGINHIEVYQTINFEDEPEWNKFDTTNPGYFNFQFSPIGIIIKDQFSLELGLGGQGLLKIGIII